MWIVTFILSNWKVILIGLVVLTITIFVYRACHKAPHLNEKEILRAQEAIAKQDREEMEKVLVENDVKSQEIDKAIEGSEQKTQEVIKESKEKVSKMTNQELADELNRRASE